MRLRLLAPQLPALLPRGPRAWRAALARTALLVVILLGTPLAGVLYCTAMPGRSWAGPPPGLDAIDPERDPTVLRAALRGHVEHLAGTIGERNLFRPAALDASRAYVTETLTSIGYTVRVLPFRVGNQDAFNVEATCPEVRSIDADIVIGAHYDTIIGTPGADDNASGVAMLLELARAFLDTPESTRLRFVAFVNEEPPWFATDDMGSAHYAEDCAARGDRITAMISLESLGYFVSDPGTQHYPAAFAPFYSDRGDFVGFVGNTASRKLTRRTIRAFREAASVPSEGVAAPGWISGIDFSDQRSFWTHGYRALMVTDTAVFRNPNYHRATDTPDTLNYDVMTLTTLGMVDVIAELCRSP